MNTTLHCKMRRASSCEELLSLIQQVEFSTLAKTSFSSTCPQLSLFLSWSKCWKIHWRSSFKSLDHHSPWVPYSNHLRAFSISGRLSVYIRLPDKSERIPRQILDFSASFVLDWKALSRWRHCTNDKDRNAYICCSPAIVCSQRDKAIQQ